MSEVNPKFKTIGEFSADGALGRQLSQLEQNAGDALTRVATQVWPRLKPTSRKLADYVAKLGELVVTGATINVRLPAATADNAGLPTGIVVKTGTVTITAPGSDVQGASSEALTVAGLYVYVSDGDGWLHHA